LGNSVSIDALRSEMWAKELYANVMDNLYFTNKNMMGTGDNNLVKVKDDLVKSNGDAINFGITYKLSGDGITGDETAEGNEEAITPYHQKVAIDFIRNQVRLTGKLDEKKNSYDMRSDAKNKLSIWLQEYIERQIFMKAGGVTTTTLTDVNGSVYSGRAAWSNSAAVVPQVDEAAGSGDRYICACATGLDDIAASDVLTVDMVTEAKVKAQLANPQIRPIKVGGMEYYVMFVHPYQAADIKKSTSNNTWFDAQKDAALRGEKNNIFTGALGIWNGVIIHEHSYVPTCQSASAFGVGGEACNARTFRALLMGQDALCYANANNNGEGFVEETFDYKNKVGYSTGFMGGIQKATFNSLDYGIITVDSGATDL